MLFGAAYGAGPHYGLLGPLTAFAALACASFAGLAAALRFGRLTAAVGLVGAFVTPALVATTDPSLPGLFAYLFVASAAALYVMRLTAWTWLGWSATIAGALWVWLGAFAASPDRWAVAAFVPAAALLHLVMLPAAALESPVGRRLSWVPFAALGAAALVLAQVAPEGAPQVALFLLSPIAVWKGVAEARLDRLPWLAALIGGLALCLWMLPGWHASPAFAGASGVLSAVIPGTWESGVARPFVVLALALAAFHAAVGLWQERRAEHAVRWAALLACVPVATLAIAYWRIWWLQPDGAWALAASCLAVGLTGAAALAARNGTRQRAGAHAAGAVAALALGCAFVLHQQWLTLAVALFLPPLAWIEARADLPALRRVALAVASLVLVRLLLNGHVLEYHFGTGWIAKGLLAAYAAPSAAFLLGAAMFRRRADDVLVTVLEAGGIGLAACFVALDVRHGYGGGLTGRFGFDEAAVQVLALAAEALAMLVIARRNGRAVAVWAWRILGGLALAFGALLVVFNPALINGYADAAALLAGYLMPALLAVRARRLVPDADLRGVLTIYASVAAFAWVTLQIRQAFHPGVMGLGEVPVLDAELWAWSGAWLVYGVALMVVGLRSGERLLRMIALCVVGLVCAKVFLVDMADLSGLWRVVSFLGLGLSLIGLASLQRRVLGRK
jgi:uncharacterized membrane protein